MKRKLVVLALAVVVIAGLVVGGCAKPAPSGPEEILVGCNAPLTGYSAAFGVGNVWGEEAAIEDINKQGGVYVEEYGRKLPIKLIVLDNESNPDKSRTLEEQLILNYKVHILADSNAVIPIVFPQAQVAEQYKVPRYSGGVPMEAWLGARSALDKPFEYTWTWSFSIVTPAPPGSYWDKPGYTILDTWKIPMDQYGDQTNKKVGVLASDEPDGRGWYALFPPALEEWGYDVIGVEDNLGLFPLGTTDYTSMIREWQKNDVEILWGNCPAGEFGTLWRQARALEFKPKMVFIGRAAMFYQDVTAWGGDLPLGVCAERWWDPSFQNCPGIGDTTPQSLFERWVEDTGQPLNPPIGWGYQQMQVIIDTIERAGTLDKEALNKALGETDMMTMDYRVKFDENHSNQKPLFFCQWHKTDEPWVWEFPTVFSQHDDVPVTGDFIFPIPYD